MGGPLLQVQGLHFAHAGDAPLFDDWSATWAAGVHGLGGESGSGKTTLLRLLAGELPCRGRLCLDGRFLDDDPAAWRRTVCRIDAGDAALDGLTPAALREAVHANHPGHDPDGWRRHLEGFGLLPHLGKTLHMLSTGMRRKAALAAALSAGAALTLLDEPTAGLDAPSVAYLVQALAAAGRQPGGITVVACGTWPAGLPLASRTTLPGP